MSITLPLLTNKVSRFPLRVSFMNTSLFMHTLHVKFQWSLQCIGTISLEIKVLLASYTEQYYMDLEMK